MATPGLVPAGSGAAETEAAHETNRTLEQIVNSVDLSDLKSAAAETPAIEEAAPATPEQEAVATETPSEEVAATPAKPLTAYQKALAKHGNPEKLGEDYWRIQSRSAELARKLKEAEAKLAQQKPVEAPPATPAPPQTPAASPAVEVAPEIAQIDTQISYLGQEYNSLVHPQNPEGIVNAWKNVTGWKQLLLDRIDTEQSIDTADPEHAIARKAVQEARRQVSIWEGNHARLKARYDEIIREFNGLEEKKQLRSQLNEIAKDRETEAKAREEAKLREEQEAEESEAIAYKEAEWEPALQSVLTAKVPASLHAKASKYVKAMTNLYLNEIDPATGEPRYEGEGIANEATFITEVVTEFMDTQREAASLHAQQKTADVRKASPAPGKATAKIPEVSKQANSVQDVLRTAGVA